MKGSAKRLATPNHLSVAEYAAQSIVSEWAAMIMIEAEWAGLELRS